LSSERHPLKCALDGAEAREELLWEIEEVARPQQLKAAGLQEPASARSCQELSVHVYQRQWRPLSVYRLTQSPREEDAD
jgi:hypothetical protein